MTRSNRAVVTLRQELAITTADEMADDVLFEAERNEYVPEYAYDSYDELWSIRRDDPYYDWDCCGNDLYDDDSNEFSDDFGGVSRASLCDDFNW
jgi:hypothetical protein